MRTPHLLALAATLSLACAEAHGNAKVSSTSHTESDTTVVTITAPESLPGLLVTLDTPSVIWTPEEMGSPNGMAVGPDGRVTVSDRGHLYAWQPGVDTTEVVSRQGSGPGEYRSLAALLGQPDGSVLVLDWRQRRMIRLDPHGSPDSTWTLAVDPAQRAFVGLMNGSPVIATDRGYVHTGEPPDTLYLRLGSDTTGPTLGSISLYIWTQLENGMLAPRDLYPPRPHLAGSATAGFAFSDGMQYDIRWWRPGASPEWLRISRTWTPPPQSIDREPPPELFTQMADSGKFVRMIVNGAKRGESKYSLEALVLMPGGSLWIQPVDSSYVYAPAYYAQLVELRQPTRLWEVIGSDGTLRAQVRLSSMFTPKTIHDCQLYGFLEDSDGAYAVATVPLGAACGKLSGT